MNKALKITIGAVLFIFFVLWLGLKAGKILNWGIAITLEIITVLIPLIVIIIIWIRNNLKKTPEKKEDKMPSILPTIDCERIAMEAVRDGFGEVFNEAPRLKQTINAGDGATTTPIFRWQCRGMMNNKVYDVLINQTNPSQISVLVNATEAVTHQAINDMSTSPARENKVQTVKSIDPETMQPIMQTFETKARPSLDIESLRKMLKEPAKEEV